MKSRICLGFYFIWKIDEKKLGDTKFTTNHTHMLYAVPGTTTYRL